MIHNRTFSRITDSAVNMRAVKLALHMRDYCNSRPDDYADDGVPGIEKYEYDPDSLVAAGVIRPCGYLHYRFTNNPECASYMAHVDEYLINAELDNVLHNPLSFYRWLLTYGDDRPADVSAADERAIDEVMTVKFTDLTRLEMPEILDQRRAAHGLPLADLDVRYYPLSWDRRRVDRNTVTYTASYYDIRATITETTFCEGDLHCDLLITAPNKGNYELTHEPGRASSLFAHARHMIKRMYIV